jgi:integrase
MVLLAFRHGLRASELVDLRWEQVDLENAILHVRRVKQGTPATHPLTGRELRALRRLQRERGSKSPFVFISERGTAFSTRGFQAMVERVAEAAGFDMKIHPHMLRHSCGYKLANDGVDTRTIQSYLGHKSIQGACQSTPLFEYCCARAPSGRAAAAPPRRVMNCRRFIGLPSGTSRSEPALLLRSR